MTIFTVVSSDKITHGMFVDYYKSVTNREVVVLEINCLLSSDTQIKAIEEAIRYVENKGKEDTTDILIKYRVKARSASVINEEILQKSNYVIKFDMFSTHPEIIKNADGDYLISFNKQWEDHIERLNK